MESVKLPDGTERSIFIGGWIFNATTDGGEEIELATDNAVVWRRGAVQNTPDGFQTGGDGNAEVEFYLSGNVIVRTKSDKSPLQVLRAARGLLRRRARAGGRAGRRAWSSRRASRPTRSTFAAGKSGGSTPRTGKSTTRPSTRASCPSDPGLRIDSGRVTYNERQVRLRNFFGLPYRDLLTGEPIYGDERTVTAYGAVPKVMGVPVWYWPRVRTDANDPLGPFVGMGFGQNRVFGTQVYTTWDIFDLFALRPPPGHRWRLNADYLSKRGPALGTDYLYKLPGSTPGMWGSEGMVKLYGIHDQGVDILGGNRGPEPVPPEFRGRAGWRHQQEILEGLYFQGQVAYLSDKNFLEQYYKNEFDVGPNQETFAYLAWNRGNFWAAGLGRGAARTAVGARDAVDPATRRRARSASPSSTCSFTMRGPTRAMPSLAAPTSTRSRSWRPTRTSTPAASISCRS